MAVFKSVRTIKDQPFELVRACRSPWFNRLITFVVLLCSAGPVSAGKQARNVPLEEILITAQRPESSRTQIIQAGTFRGADQLNTPLTVSVVGDQIIRAQQDQSLGEVLRNAAGVTGLLVTPSVYTNASIRGIPVNGRTNVKLNGSLSIVNFIDLPLEDKSRIEVLKGVSALYYGFATPSGIINMVMRGPPNAPELSVSFSGNHYGQVQGAVDGGAMLGAVGLRGTIAAGSVDSGIRQTRGNRALEAAVISVEPSNTIRLDLNFEHISKSVTEPTILQGPEDPHLLLTQLPRLPNPRTNPGSVGFMNHARELNLLARIRWMIARSWTLTAEGGLSNAERDRRFSILGDFDPITGLGTLTAQAANGQLYHNSGVRLDLTGNLKTGPISQELVLGVSRQRSRQYFPPARTVAGVASLGGCLQLGLGPFCVQSAFDPILLRDVNFNGDVPYAPNRDTKNIDMGLYAFDRIRFGGASEDRMQLIIGIRQSFYREYVALDRNEWRRTFTANPITVSAAAIYRPRINASIYASYIEGIESEPPAPNLTVNAGEVLPPGRSRQKEVGAKVSVARHLLQLNLAYFDIDRRLTYVNSANRFVDDGTGHYNGVEVGLEGNVTPDFSVIGSAILLNAREAVSGDPVIDGKRVENSAHWQWSLFGDYKLSGRLPAISLNGGIFFTSRRPINPENSFFVPGYTTFDVGLAYVLTIAKLPVTARLNASNILSKRYVASTGSNLLAMGMPMTIRFALTAKIF